MNKMLLKLCRKDITTKEGKSFYCYFAYRLRKNDDGSYSETLTPSVNDKGESVMRAIPIHVSLVKDLNTAVENMINDNKLAFPLLIEVDATPETGNCFLTIDKDKDKNPKISPITNKVVPLLVITEFSSSQSFPKSSITFENIDDYLA